jgi:REP element-mobilizing transposase RayT
MADRCWFLTWTTYGSWLPGDERGFVGFNREFGGARQSKHLPSGPVEKPNEALKSFSQAIMRGEAIRLNLQQAEVLFGQFQETASYRNWTLLAVAIMANHIHCVLGVMGDPKPEDLLRDLKSYGSRSLNRIWGKPKSETWWTESGSRRKLHGEGDVKMAVDYAESQEFPLLIWTWEKGRVV